MVAVVSLTVVANDYKMKVNESKKVANLYGAESGLNMAYNVLVKTFDYAVDVANQKVESTKFDKNLDLDKGQEAMNDVFQKAFIDVFESKNLPGIQTESEINDILKYCLSHQVYPIFKDNKVVFLNFEFASSEQLDIQVDKVREDLKFHFTFTSDFVSQTEVNKSNQRQVSVKYSVNVPTYQGALKEELTKVQIEDYPVFIDSVVNIDGNAELTGTVEVNGNLRVKGESDEISDFVYGKYSNGVQIQEGELSLNGNLITNETFSLNENTDVTVTGNVFARNVYVGKREHVSVPTNANLTVSQSVLLDNDLAVNVQIDPSGKKSTVQVDNLYGLNDKNVIDQDGNLARESSSLIVNSEGSTVTVNNETYLSGVAYIDTKGESYQTGESVAIRGNYLVYSEILPGYEGRVQMKYYNPLLLIESIDGESSLDKKAEYFVAASKDGSLELSDGGIHLNPEMTHTVGAWVSNGAVGSSSSPFVNEELNDERELYASQVFNMGMKDSEATYTEGKVLKTVANQINFEHQLFQISDQDFNNYYGEVILNGDQGVSITIEANDDGTNEVLYINEDKEIIKTVSNVSKAIIITNGHVLLKGDVNFTGNIIATGSLSVDKSNRKINLEFNQMLTQKIIASNYEKLEPIFNIDSIRYHLTEVEVVEGLGLDDIETKYYAEDYIRLGRWQLLK